MIKPLAASDIARGNFVACDIENWPNGDVLSIDTCWRDSGTIHHELHWTWADWFDWIVKRGREDKRFRCVYAHNGGGWDWLSLAAYLLRDGKRKRQFMTGAVAASKLITLTVKIESQFTVHLCDSLQLLRSPLKALADKFDVTRKIELGGLLPHEIWQQNKELYYRYVRNDTEALLEVLEKALDLIRERVAQIDTFGYTIGSTALKVFKTMLSEPIATPWEMRVKSFLRKGYKGGRVEVFKPGVYGNITVYDVNSLYPYAMLTTDVPVSDRGVWVSDFDPTLSGCYEIEFEQRNHDVPAVLMVDGVGAYSGSGHYFTPEINTLLKYGNPVLKIKTGYVFLDNAKLFQDYVNRLYQVRLDDPDGPASLLAKFLLNSLYGKFAQNPERASIISITNFDELYSMCSDGAKITQISDELGVYNLTTESEVQFEHVGIAGMITASARTILYEGIIRTGNQNVVYCDTDSVHTTGELPCNMVGKAIGLFKKEFQGEGIYVGKKLYALREFKFARKYVNGSAVRIERIKKRAKGVTIGGRNGSSVRYVDFARMAEGEKIRCEFQQPATAKQVFAGAAPCVFVRKHRTIGIFTGNTAATETARKAARKTRTKTGGNGIDPRKLRKQIDGGKLSDESKMFLRLVGIKPE